MLGVPSPHSEAVGGGPERIKVEIPRPPFLKGGRTRPGLSPRGPSHVGRKSGGHPMKGQSRRERGR
eukprot:9874977-Alexandrium_andersonii.AAC.1